MNSCDWLPPIAPECASTAMILQPAAVEDPAIGLVVLLVGGVQAGGVHVEGVRVLHDELPHAQQAATSDAAHRETWSGSDTRSAAAACSCAVRRARWMVMTSSCVMPRHRSRPKRSFSRNMLSPMTSQRPDSCQTSAGFSAGSSISCAADGVHLLAHDRDDLQQRALREKQVAVDARRQLADVARRAAAAGGWPTSASAGVSRSVGMNSLLQSIIKGSLSKGSVENSSHANMVIPL